MPGTDHSRVHARWGEADGYWDISFTEAQRAYAGINVDDEMEPYRSISVHVDATSGVVTLNAGYETGSQPDREERQLFDGFADAIDAALIEAMGSQSPEHKAFEARTRADTARRVDALKRLDADVDQHERDRSDAYEEEVA